MEIYQGGGRVEPRIGFSTGCLFRHVDALSQKLEAIRKIGCKTVELGFVRLHEFEDGEFERLTAQDLGSFEYISLHAPVKVAYGHNPETEAIFHRISALNRRWPLATVVFHPETVQDFLVFESVDFNVAFENMDHRKETHRTPGDFAQIFSPGSTFGFVLDVNHIYTNDSSMALAQEFYRAFGDKLVEIHASGYRGYHEPLHETKQIEIIKALRNPLVPIIIESIMPPEALAQERDYIWNALSGLA